MQNQDNIYSKVRKLLSSAETHVDKTIVVELLAAHENYRQNIINANKSRVDLFLIFEKQNDLQIKMGYPMGHGVQGFKESMLAAQVEIVEALNELPWKPWKNYPVDYSVEAILHNAELRKNIATEITDIFQMVVNGALALGLTAEDLSTAITDKWMENYARINNGSVTKA